MNKGYKMTSQQKEQRFRQTLENQAQKMFSQQTSQANPTNDMVEFTSKPE